MFGRTRSKRTSKAPGSRRALVALCAATLLIAAAPASAQTKPDPSQNLGRPTPRQPVKTPEDRRRERMEQLEEQRRRIQEAAGETIDNADNKGAGDVQPLGTQLLNDAIAASDIDPEGTVLLSFGDQPVDINAFVDYVARTLKINVMTDDGLAGRQFQFNATQRVESEQLLNLLATMVEQQGFALTLDPDMGWYRIIPVADVDANFKGGQFSTTRIIPTPLLRPSQIDALVQKQLGADGLRSSHIDEIGVVILTGPPKTLDMYEQLLIEITKPFSQRQWHRFELQHVAAEFAIQRIITINARNAQPQGLATNQPNVAATGAVGQLSDLGSRILPDHGNTLLFQGTPEEAERVQEYIILVDVTSTLIMKRYLAGADVIDIATAGEGMGLGSVEYQQTGTAGAPQIRPGIGGGRIAQGFNQPSGENVSGSRFIVDVENGSILYYGTDSQHIRVEQLVDQFAAQAIGRRVEIKQYKLNHADAEEVATLLNELLADPTARTGTSPFLPSSGTQQNIGGLRQQITEALADQAGAGEGDVSIINLEEVTIVSDDARNQVLIRAPSRQQIELQRIIRQIDQRQPQVFIEAQIVLVTSRHGFDWTVELEANPGEFLLFTNFGIGGGGTVPGSNARTVPAGLLGGTTALVQNDYVPFIVRALETQSEQSIISSPKILVNDNAQADLQSTRDEPYATTTQNAGTAVTGQGGTVSAGTTLNVTPQISAGGFMSLEYAVELSDFDSDSQQPGLAPPTNRETYSGTVTVPSDMTVVVGGLVQRDEGEVEVKIPILGDIPFIGALFKTYGQDFTYRTIYVFITPRIIYPENAERMRLITEGPMAAVGIQDEIPDLEPVVIPVESVKALMDRLLPENKAPSLSSVPKDTQ